MYYFIWCEKDSPFFQVSLNLFPNLHGVCIIASWSLVLHIFLSRLKKISSQKEVGRSCGWALNNYNIFQCLISFLNFVQFLFIHVHLFIWGHIGSPSFLFTKHIYLIHHLFLRLSFINYNVFKFLNGEYYGLAQNSPTFYKILNSDHNRPSWLFFP